MATKSDYPEDEGLPELGQTFLTTLDAAASPRQQQLAVEINRRLVAGESVEDVRPLIERMTRLVTAEQQEREQGPRVGTEDPDEPTVLREQAW